ncbi:zinc ABC transporter substrate-binding protein ZnuA [Glaesserella parasuis]|uniref:High-affinity zinc uptake system protein ZnuA n=1 Tax=Glaesserella parasuis HPS9 TaxID=1450513 RepID=A0A836MBN2_GLAPU|nr:zinc ABC transporter substrate-binding protein ZnuA [Glaesserella parasuis]KDB46007.1 zinc ABC transporter substrate-binding protein [Glaesserella parasuis HPS9]KDD79751.1 zinc ABC transporter substrate-binding protein [Glaesserella parasuis ST4-2]MCT8546185.1 zinc ABC transporter substrate-binding protein ZnuA [Glaesserella parasuis]MCT8550493.1 zinc ABC transporter substrate-binding protein ZnuA [Glaesserella parasuis]MCT8592045.1 zinc ABC transporter substrate-binding protein ZnuA [Glaes
MFKKSLLSLALLGATAVTNADVLTTVKPLGFIANAITDGVTETKVLLPTSASPHDYSLKPSDVEQLQSAQLVVWIGEEMETFLEKSIEKLPKEKVLTLEDVPAIKELVEHSGEEKEDKHDHKHDHKHEHKHSHNHAHHDHSHDGHSHDEDWHIWLSPKASEHIAEQIAERLSQQLPEQKAKIAENLANFKATLATKNSEIAKQLEPVKSKGYYTFHDAYGYFEEAYGLKSLGSFTINPTVAPGAKTLNAIKKSIAQKKVQCLFAEPQFTPKVIESLSKGTSAKVGQLDPLGAKIELSKNAYPEFLQSLADQFGVCLAQ